MIFSSSAEPEKEVFNKLLNDSIDILNKEALATPDKMKKLAGTHLEQYVRDIMAYKAVDTAFENTIECLGGISFPDIIANNFYGVEVKTTIKNHWKTTGNSVLENTRRSDVERIYLLFGKLGDPVEFRYRAYEECLSEVVVTHSPRYLIDMNLAADKTIFDKINIPYDTLRKNENPIRPIVNYYKSLLKPGEELWWIDPSNPEPMNLVIRLWNNLSVSEKNEYISRSFVYFPELLGKKSTKYNGVAVWLSTSQGIVCPNVRDNFSAGGKINLVLAGKSYDKVPQIFQRMFENKDRIVQVLKENTFEEFNTFWKTSNSNRTNIDIWIDIVTDYSKKVLKPGDYDLIYNMYKH